MAYILFVNPHILSVAGVPENSAIACTALAAGICCLLMGLYSVLDRPPQAAWELNAVAFQFATHCGGWRPRWD